MKTRRQFSPEFKAKVALEAIKGLTPLNELAAKYEIHPVQLANWKKAAVEGLAAIFESPRSREATESGKRGHGGTLVLADRSAQG